MRFVERRTNFMKMRFLELRNNFMFEYSSVFGGCENLPKFSYFCNSVQVCFFDLRRLDLMLVKSKDKFILYDSQSDELNFFNTISLKGFLFVPDNSSKNKGIFIIKGIIQKSVNFLGQFYNMQIWAAELCVHPFAGNSLQDESLFYYFGELV